ncbi:MAG: penicillin-binding protein activator [Burkholderiales bacterium]
MQGLVTFVLILVATLYGPGTAAATEAGAAAAPKPHIALLLPTTSPSLAQHANSVRQGILAAARVEGKGALPVTVYAIADEEKDVVANYEFAVAQGARIVIGPLTRPGINALVARNAVSVPTLSLNLPDANMPMPALLYVLSLQAEPEARQVASFARNEGRIAALVITSDSPLAKRTQRAFSEEFERGGGRVAGVVKLPADSKLLGKLRGTYAASGADMIFFACDGQRARFLRAFADKGTPFYGTSQLFAIRGDSMTNSDLEGVRFLDMPWLLQPDHPAVMVYPRPNPATASNDHERLYALGIDAYRVSQTLLDAPPPSVASLDGVTGRIDLSAGPIFERALTPAELGQDPPKLLNPSSR